MVASVILRSSWPLVVLLALALSFLSFFSAPYIVGLFHDDGIYAVVAKAISQGDGYRIISLPGDPYQTKYPFLYSYVLSWAWALDRHFPANIALLQLATAIFYFASLLLAYALYLRNSTGGKADAVLYVFLVGANVWVFSATGYPLSDIPFMATSLFCLILSDPANSFLTRTKSIVLLAFGVGVAFLVRQAGSALILAGLAYFLLSKKREEFYLYTCIVGSLILPWVFWQAMYSSAAAEDPLLVYYQSYENERPAFFLVGSDPAAAFQIIWDNICYLAWSIDYWLLLHIVPALRPAIYLTMLWGLVSIMRRQTIFFTGFVLVYSALILSWPWHPARYLMPLIPILLLSLFHGVQAVSAIVRSRATTAWAAASVPIVARIPIGIIVALTVAWLWQYVHVDRNNHIVLWGGFRTSYGWNGFTETFSWIKQHTQTDDVLATAYDPMYYLYTGRKSVRPWIHRPQTYFYPYGNAKPDLGSVEEIRDSLDNLGVRFLIVNPMEGYTERDAAAELFATLLSSYRVEPDLVFESSDGLHKIYALPPPDSTTNIRPVTIVRRE